MMAKVPRMVFLETADVARLLGITVAMVRVYVRAGRLIPVAETPRGTRLFRPADIAKFRRIREARGVKSRYRGSQ